jgi:23S rRNA (adenine2030-N6)-methyltransferase
MERALKHSGIRDVQQFELGIRDEDRPGMGSCGLFVVNPPWTLLATLQSILPWLAQQLGEQGQGHYRAEVLVGE